MQRHQKQCSSILQLVLFRAVAHLRELVVLRPLDSPRKPSAVVLYILVLGSLSWTMMGTASAVQRLCSSLSVLAGLVHSLSHL